MCEKLEHSTYFCLLSHWLDGSIPDLMLSKARLAQLRWDDDDEPSSLTLSACQFDQQLIRILSPDHERDSAMSLFHRICGESEKWIFTKHPQLILHLIGDPMKDSSTFKTQSILARVCSPWKSSCQDLGQMQEGSTRYSMRSELH